MIILSGSERGRKTHENLLLTQIVCVNKHTQNWDYCAHTHTVPNIHLKRQTNYLIVENSPMNDSCST